MKIVKTLLRNSEYSKSDNSKKFSVLAQILSFLYNTYWYLLGPIVQSWIGENMGREISGAKTFLLVASIVNPPNKNLLFWEPGWDRFLFQKVLRLISRYKGSYLKGAFLIQAFSEPYKDGQPYFLFWERPYGPNN